MNTAIIGCGAISKNHGQAVNNLEGVTLRYCVDTDKEKADQFHGRFGGEALGGIEELLEKDDYEVVHICTPHWNHHDLAIEFLKRGKHVFCEKPMAITAREAQKVLDVSRETGMKYGVCFQNRMNASTVRARQILENREYGEIVSAMVLVAWDRHGDYYSKSPWRGSFVTEGGGCIINQAIHSLDLLDYLTGGVESLTAYCTKLRETDDYEVDDSSMINFRLKNGAVAVGYTTNCYPMSKIAQVEIHCEKGTLTVQQSGLQILTEGKTEFFENAVAVGEKSEWGLSHGLVIDEFYRSIGENRPFFIDGESAIRAVKIVNAIQNSKGNRIKI